MKKIVSAVLIIAVMLCFASCGKAKQVDKTLLADYVLKNVSFAEQLESVDADYALASFGLDKESCSVICYNTSNAVADIFAVFEANDADYVDDIEAAVQSQIDYLRQGYSSYGPNEVPKIDSAVVITSGNLVVFCICPDNAAASQLIQEVIGC